MNFKNHEALSMRFLTIEITSSNIEKNDKIIPREFTIIIKNENLIRIIGGIEVTLMK